MSERFRPAERIKRRTEFQQVFDKGVRVHGRFMTLLVLPNSLDVTRLGIVASRKLGGAVRRNRAKRLVRELFRRNKMGSGVDIIVIARPELLEASHASLQDDYTDTLRRVLRRSR